MTQELGTIAGKVSKVAHKDGQATGVQLEGRGEEWLNFSLPEYRGTFEIPERGDNVKLGTARSKDGRLFIKTCEIQHKAEYDVGQVPTAGRDLSISRSVALKAATDVAVALINQGRYQDEPDFGATKQLGVDIPGLAADLERWLVREEIAFE